MYRYETHMHTLPVSKCARETVRNNVEFYHEMGFAGIFITNHFLDGNINIDRNLPYEEKVNFYFGDLEEARIIGRELGIAVFGGVELSYGGTDFLIYGPDKDWYLAHPEIMDMKKSQELAFLIESGALVIQAHPYREASYIDHIRLYPRQVHGVEICNASCGELQNKMAAIYAEGYELLPFAGSDNHGGRNKARLAGVEFASPVVDEWDFVRKVKAGEHTLFDITIE